MRNLLAFLALASTGTLAVACSQPTLEETVQQFLDSKGIASATDCGDVDLDLTCSAETPQAVQCFLDAFATCKPARLTTKRSTIEGDPIFTEYVVIQGAVDCDVEMFLDTTQDNFGVKTISRESCEGVIGKATCESTLEGDQCFSPCDDGTDCG